MPRLLGGRILRVRIVAHDPKWQSDYTREAKQIRDALGEVVFAVHHIGSTAIPGIYAKPIIDLCVEVVDTEELDARSSVVESLGYEALGEFGIPGRRFFRKDDAAGVRTHHIHAFESGTPGVIRHLAFRDYMVAHATKAEAYSQLKRKLARDHADDLESYIEGKDTFIKQHEAMALEWRNENVL